jgi:hypothetical protein
MTWLIALLLQLNVLSTAADYNVAEEREYVRIYAPDKLEQYDAGGPGSLDLDTF